MKRIVLILVTVAAIVTSFALPVAASADYSVLGQACSSGSTAAACNDQNNATDPVGGPKGIIHNVTILVARFAGAIAVIVVIYGGFRMVTGGNDPGKVKEARETIIYALVGVVIIAIGQTIIIFIVDRV